MVTMIYYIFRHSAGVIVTKGSGSLGGGWRRRHGGLLGISWLNGTGLLWISLFSAKNIPFKTLEYKSFKSQGLANYVS